MRQGRVDTFTEVRAVMDQQSPPLKDESNTAVVFFAGHKKVYPRVVRGLYRQVKWLMLATILTMYYAMPLIRWNRGPGRGLSR